MVSRSPSSATVGEMGMKPDMVKRLSPAGQKMSKADLISLWGNKVSANASKATLGDIELIKQAFIPVAGATNLDVGDINCCCCPCCCATAVIKPVREVA